MTNTSVATGDNQVRKLWNEQLFRAATKESFFYQTGLMGDGENKAVQVNTELTKTSGDRVRFHLVPRLTGSGVTEGQTLRGNEEALQTYTFDVTLEELAHAVASDGPLSRQRAIYEFEKTAKEKLQGWMSEKIDEKIFSVLTGASAAPTKVFYKTSSGIQLTATENTAKTALTAADSKLTPAMLTQMGAWARSGGNRTQEPLRPIRIDGEDFLVLLVHNDVAADFFENSAFQAAMTYAEARGKDNPLFRGSKMIYNNIIVRAHENCTIATDGGGASVAWSRAVLMGQQAVCWAWGERPKLLKDMDDYGRVQGVGISSMYGVAKTKFNSLDYGSIGVFLARTKISDL